MAKPKAKAKPKPKQKKQAAPPSTTPAQRDFLATIIANPDDKKARLVYADLLQEQGDPRGAFIVAQCTRAELADDDPRTAALDKEIADLLAKHKKSWAAALGENKGARLEYRRGFVEKLSLDANDLVTNGAKIFATEPLEELNVWKIDESKHKAGKSRLAPVLALPLGNVRRLSLARCKLGKEDFEALAAAKTLGKVEVLDLTNGGSAMTPLAPLAKAKSLPKLRELRIGGCMCGDQAIVALAKSTTLAFSRLVAVRNDITDEGCAAIADATWAPKLEHLDLSSNEELGRDGLEALGQSTKLTALKSLKLEYVGFFENVAEMVLASPVFTRLDHLDLSMSMSAADRDQIRAVLGDRLKG